MVHTGAHRIGEYRRRGSDQVVGRGNPERSQKVRSPQTGI